MPSRTHLGNFAGTGSNNITVPFGTQLLVVGVYTPFNQASIPTITVSVDSTAMTRLTAPSPTNFGAGVIHVMEDPPSGTVPIQLGGSGANYRDAYAVYAYSDLDDETMWDGEEWAEVNDESDELGVVVDSREGDEVIAVHFGYTQWDLDYLGDGSEIDDFRGGEAGDDARVAVAPGAPSVDMRWGTEDPDYYASVHAINIRAAAGGGGGELVEIPAAELAIEGLPPIVAITANVVVAVPAGTLAALGLAPAVFEEDPVQVAVPAAELAVEGTPPTVASTANETVAVPAGGLALEGLPPLPFAGASVFVGIPAGALAVDGLAPVVEERENVWVGVPAGELAVAGLAPTVAFTESVWVQVPVGALAALGEMPVVAAEANVWVLTPAGELAVVGTAPVVFEGAQVQVQVPAGAIAIEGQPPVARSGANVWVSVPVGALALEGQVPLVYESADRTVIPPSAELAVASAAPFAYQVCTTRDEITLGQGSLYTFLGGDVLHMASLSRGDSGQRLVGSGRTADVAPFGSGGEGLFTNLYVRVRSYTAGIVTVTPIVDGERLEDEAVAIRVWADRVPRTVEVGLAQGEEIRQGLRGTWFAAHIQLEDLAGCGRLIVEGVELEAQQVTEGVEAREFRARDEALAIREVSSWTFLGTDQLAEYGSGRLDLEAPVEARARSNIYAPAGAGGEAIFTNVYLTLTRANDETMSLLLTPIVDGVEQEPIELELEGVSDPVKAVHELGLAVPWPSAADPQILQALRGEWAQIQIDTAGGLPAGRVEIDGIELEVEIVTEGKEAENGA